MAFVDELMQSIREQGGNPTAAFTPQPTPNIPSPTNMFGQFKTRGFGTMPEGASPSSQALRAGASGINWGNLRYGGLPGADPRATYLEGLAEQGDISRQSELEQQQRGIFTQQLRAATLRNQALERLLAMVSGGPGGTIGGAGGAGPGQNFLQKFLQSGGLDTPLMRELIAGGDARVRAAFEGPGGYLRKIQGLNAAQDRFTGGSSVAAEREAIGSRQRGLALAQVPGQAFAAAAPELLRAASTLTGTEVTPIALLRTLSSMTG